MLPKKISASPQTSGWVAQGGELVWIRRDQPSLPPDWARLRLVLGGVCGTDLHILAGYAGFSGFLGHEFVADVVECASPEWVGVRVVGGINVAEAADPRFSPERRVLGLRGLDGVFAESFQLPVRNLLAIDALDPQLAVWAEPVAAALEVAAHIPAGTPVAVLGDGRLGALIALVLRRDHPVTVFGKHAHKLRRLAALGLATASDSSDEFPAVVEATGSAGGFAAALERVEPQGIVVLKSTVAVPQVQDLNPVILKAVQVVGSRCGDIGAALQVLRAGEVDPRPLVDAVVPLSRLPEAIQGMRERGWLKVLVSGPEPAGSNSDAQSR